MSQQHDALPPNGLREFFMTLPLWWDGFAAANEDDASFVVSSDTGGTSLNHSGAASPFGCREGGRTPTSVPFDLMTLFALVPMSAELLKNNPIAFYHTIQSTIATIAQEAHDVLQPPPAQLADAAAAAPPPPIRADVRDWVRNYGVRLDVTDQLRRIHNICLRPLHAPPSLLVSDVRFTSHNNGVVQVVGTIVRMSAKRVVPYYAVMECPVCKTRQDIYSLPHDRAAAIKANCDQSKCRRQPMQRVSECWMDYAECILQQRPSAGSSSGRLPRSITVALDDDLAKHATVGQLAEITGLVRTRWKSVGPQSFPQVELMVHAWNVAAITGAALARMTACSSMAGTTASGATTTRRETIAHEITNTRGGVLMHDKDMLRALLCLSICPHISGMFAPRLAVLLSAVGGVRRLVHSSMSLRGTLHLLLVGDPSTGKSQLLRAAAEVAPRSTTTAGMGSTSAGLTAAASKENGEWSLEPGALVLSDGGSCIIDELRTVSATDRTSLHEAMEQQTISVAKAGLVATLRTACSVIAACNPPYRRGAAAQQGISSLKYSQTDMGVGGPLLSRFDFIFQLWDSRLHDERVAACVLQCATSVPPPPFTVPQVRTYALQCRGRQTPAKAPPLTASITQILSRYYAAQRARGGSPAIDNLSVTVRFLEATIRITQAHAALLGRDSCTDEDAAMTVLLMEQSAHSLRLRLPDDENSFDDEDNAIGPIPEVLRSRASQSDLVAAATAHQSTVSERSVMDEARAVEYACSSMDRIFLDASREGSAAQQVVLRRVLAAVNRLPLPTGGPTDTTPAKVTYDSDNDPVTLPSPPTKRHLSEMPPPSITPSPTRSVAVYHTQSEYGRLSRSPSAISAATLDESAVSLLAEISGESPVRHNAPSRTESTAASMVRPPPTPSVAQSTPSLSSMIAQLRGKAAAAPLTPTAAPPPPPLKPRSSGVDLLARLSYRPPEDDDGTPS